ncbi:GNAT family N-acetyltransferase [Glaciibacter superstes]|uniref:GNAT family N-acetyltransferase n=1 Tax=Glaciibacter superstes TaxID=501023 RepID=UPI0003FFE310|nr:GNAT family N-acetyltransferase [Glaciibacter superstes]
MAKDFTHEPDARRYALRIDDQLVGVLDYAISGNSIALTRSFTQPPFRGNGFASELVEYTVNDIEATTGYRVVPSCWFVGEWFEARPERQGLLSR